jgi:hypothetical protein
VVVAVHTHLQVTLFYRQEPAFLLLLAQQEQMAETVVIQHLIVQHWWHKVAAVA